MKTMSKGLALVTGGIVAAFALATAQPPNRTEPARKTPAAGAPVIRASQTHAPLLLDASWKVAAKAASGSDNPGERGDLILPKPGLMRMAMDILVDGRPLRTVHHGGKVYLPVPRLEEEYEIRVWNHGPRRVAAVISVDGLSVITGQQASENDPGYLVSPYNHIHIKGWRRSLDQVAVFRFVERNKSYGHLMGKPENIGVIGLVAFEERVIHPMPQLERRDAASTAKGFRTEVGSIGTEYGREVDSRAYYVPFLRSGNKQTITFYYDTVEALRAAGVPVDRPLPIPFPGDVKFAPPPPGYRGK